MLDSQQKQTTQIQTRLTLASLWTATMLTYLLGDVLRIMSGDMQSGQLADGMAATQSMWLLIAIIMLVPILMVVLNTILSCPAVRRTNFVVGLIVIVFNLFGLPYKGAYDNFLIIVSLIFNALILWYAWKWAPELD